MISALFLINKNSRSGQEASEWLTPYLEQLGFSLTVPTTDSPADVAEAIEQHHKQVDLIIIAGGDGSINAAAKGLVNTEKPLGIIPLGTANDLAKTLGIPDNPEEACQLIKNAWLAQNIKPINMGAINNQLFFNVAHLGISSEVTKQLDKSLKKRWGIFAYLLACIRAARAMKKFNAEVQIDDREPVQLKSIQISIGNGRFYGGGLAIRDDANIDTVRLDFSSIRPQRFYRLLLAFPSVKLGRQRYLREVDEFTGQSINIETQLPIKITADGEDLTQTPAKITVLPNAVNILAPANYTQLLQEQAHPDKASTDKTTTDNDTSTGGPAPYLSNASTHTMLIDPTIAELQFLSAKTEEHSDRFEFAATRTTSDKLKEKLSEFSSELIRLQTQLDELIYQDGELPRQASEVKEFMGEMVSNIKASLAKDPDLVLLEERHNDGEFIQTAIKHLLNGEPASHVEKPAPEENRQLIHLSDAARAIIEILQQTITQQQSWLQHQIDTLANK